MLDEVLGGAEAMATRLAAELRVIERAGHTLQTLEGKTSPAHAFLIDLLQHRRAHALDRLVRGLSFAPDNAVSRLLREGLASNDRARREAAVEHLSASVAPSIGERLLAAYRATVEKEALLTTPTDVLRARTWSVNPYVRAAARYLLGEHGGADDPTLARLSKDEHRVVREVASCLQERMREGMCAPDRSRPLTTLEKMLALHDAPLLCRLAPEGLADLARSSIETAYAPGSTLFREGELGDEVLILLAGEVTSFQDGGAEEHIISAEAPGRLIGETVGLAPAPRSATVCAGAEGARVLCLHGDAFRKAMNAHPAMTSEVIRLFAQRLHGRIEGEEPSCMPSGARRMA